MPTQDEPDEAVRRPVLPRISRDERRQLATEWLLRCSQPATPERIEALAPLVDRYHPSGTLGQIANHLVSQGQLPTPGEVRRVFEDRGMHIHYTADDEVVKKLVAWIAIYTEETGQGPMWSELAQYMRWSIRKTGVALRQLRRLGLVTFNDEHRSLRAAPGSPKGADL